MSQKDVSEVLCACGLGCQGSPDLGLRPKRMGRIPMGGWGRHWISSLGLLRTPCKDELGQGGGGEHRGHRLLRIKH